MIRCVIPPSRLWLSVKAWRPLRMRFAAYWRVIYPGSALIRVMWLRAIKQRAEAASGG